MKPLITFFRGHEFTGKAKEFESASVVYISPAPGEKADVEFRKYTANYIDYADRKFFVNATRRRYKTLEAAVEAAVAAKATA